MLAQIDHVNIVVDDLDAMKRFYRDRLGMKVTKEVTIRGEWIDAVVGLNNVEADVVYLEPPSGARLELIKYRSPSARSDSSGGEPNTPGLRHLAFQVDDVDVTLAEIRRRGTLELVGAVSQVPSEQVSYAGGLRKRLVYFRDPEGNLVELCEYRASDATSPTSSGAPRPDRAAAKSTTLSPRQRRAKIARRRMYTSTFVLVLLAGAVYAVYEWVPASLVGFTAETSKPSTAPSTVPVYSPTDLDAPNVVARRQRYLKTEGHHARRTAFSHLGASVHTARMYGARLTQEEIVAQLGPPDLFRDLGPFRTFAYFYSEQKMNDCVLDVGFDRNGYALNFKWDTTAEADHSAKSWQRFPTTQSTEPKEMIKLLPKLEVY